MGCARAGAQAPAPAAASLPTFAARSDLVVLSVTAVDSKGRPVDDLKPHELRIFEEGRPQKLVRFSAARDLRARVLLLLDQSGSMNGERKASSARMAALQVLGALDPEDEVALAAFDGDYLERVGFTRDRESLRQGLEALRPFGATALHDALDRAAGELAARGEGRRAVVVVTDGVDTASRKTPAEVVARSRALDVPIYALSVVSPLDDPGSALYAGRERPTPAASRFAATPSCRGARLSP